MSEAEDRDTDNVVDLPDEDVDVDLDEMDEQLRSEALGKSTTVKIDGVVIHIAHAGDWSASAMQGAAQGDWDTWAREVIDNDDEYQAWSDANLKNYQIEAVFRECGRKARLSMGKSQRRSGQRRSTRRR
jgi:hypothetical protein